MRIAKYMTFISLLTVMLACQQPNLEHHLEHNQKEEYRQQSKQEPEQEQTNHKLAEQQQPASATEKQSNNQSNNRNTLQKPLQLTENQLLVISNQLYFYHATQDSITPIMLDGTVGFTIPSPSKKFVAVTKGQYHLLILNQYMNIEKEYHLLNIDEQDEEHILYQYANERSFSEIEKPALYINDHLIYQASQPDSFIGKISVNTNTQHVIFPLTEKGQTMLVIGKYELATNPLKQIEQYSLNFADNEQLLDYVLDANLQEGYVISQREGEINSNQKYRQM